MGIFWMGAASVAVKLGSRVAFCHSLTLHCCKMHLSNFVLSQAQLWESLTQYNPCKLTQIIQCNGFQILSQVLINLSFPQYWIQLYFLTLLQALIGSLEYFQSFNLGESEYRGQKLVEFHNFQRYPSLVWKCWSLCQSGKKIWILRGLSKRHLPSEKIKS